MSQHVRHNCTWHTRICIWWTLVGLLLLDGIVSGKRLPETASRPEVTIDGVMPTHPTTERDSYLCTRVEIPADETFNVVRVEPLADKKQVHHMLLFGCEEYAAEMEADVWSCHMSAACKGMENVLYGWGRNAPMVTMPDGVGFTIGKRSSMRMLVLQVHYLELRSEQDASGIRIHLSRVPIERVAGMQAFASRFSIPPGKKSHPVRNSCCYDGVFPSQTFASRVHTHELGRRVTLYVKSPQEDEAVSVVDLDPLKPQGFYPTKTEMKLLPGDVLDMTCEFNSESQTETVSAGMTSKDEMCNLYLMSHSLVPMFSMCVDGAKLVKEGHGISSKLVLNSRIRKGFGQLSGVFHSMHTPEYLWIFHRGTRIWDASSFDSKTNVFIDTRRVQEDTISRVHIDSGRVEESFGSEQFLMPHMITEAPDGGLWVTDAGSHQVMKIVENKIVSTLGTFNVPGDSPSQFCKPTEALETRDGRLLIADGYCNNRIVEMNAKDATIVHVHEIPVKNSLPHSIAYDECHSIVYVALRQAQKIIALDLNSGMFRTPSWDVSGFGYPYAVRMGMDSIPYVLTWDMKAASHLVELGKKPSEKESSFRSWKLDGVQSPHDFVFLPSPISDKDVTERNISIMVAETRPQHSTGVVFVFVESDKDNHTGPSETSSQQNTVASHSTLEGLERVENDPAFDSTLMDEASMNDQGYVSKFIFVFSLCLSGVVLWGFVQTFETSHKLVRSRL